MWRQKVRRAVNFYLLTFVSGRSKLSFQITWSGWSQKMQTLSFWEEEKILSINLPGYCKHREGHRPEETKENQRKKTRNAHKNKIQKHGEARKLKQPIGPRANLMQKKGFLPELLSSLIDREVKVLLWFFNLESKCYWFSLRNISIILPMIKLLGSAQLRNRCLCQRSCRNSSYSMSGLPAQAM